MLTKNNTADKIIACIWAAFLIYFIIALFLGFNPLGFLPYNPEWEIR